MDRKICKTRYSRTLVLASVVHHEPASLFYASEFDLPAAGKRLLSTSTNEISNRAGQSPLIGKMKAYDAIGREIALFGK